MIEVCPECDTANIWKNNGGLTGPEGESAYGCKCGARFDEPVQREAKHGSNTKGLAAKLEEMDP